MYNMFQKKLLIAVASKWVKCFDMIVSCITNSFNTIIGSDGELENLKYETAS